MIAVENDMGLLLYNLLYLFYNVRLYTAIACPIPHYYNSCRPQKMDNGQ